MAMSKSFMRRFWRSQTRNKLKRWSITVIIAVSSALAVCAQSGDNISVSGSIQSDFLLPTGRQSDGSHEYLRTNTYADLQLLSSHLDAGLRFEYLEHPLPGFERDFKGWGIPYIYVKGKLKSIELTAGNIYEQFGSGFILRTYEDRSLGIDNSILGGRLAVRPVKGISLKALSGKQRRYWGHNSALITGADAEVELQSLVPAISRSQTALTLSLSWVNKHEGTRKDHIMADATHRLRLPQNVNAWNARLGLQTGDLNLTAEYARKSQDPNFDNGYIYRHGYATMLSSSYSRRGMSLLVQAKRSDNFSFRSKRNITGISSMLNYLPPFTQDHTYALAALYPYATNPMGEWAYQAQAGYTIKKNTPLGGRYGTSLRLNFSHVHGINQNPHPLTLVNNGENAIAAATYTGAGSKGYGSKFWKWGPHTYYQDLNLQIDKRLSTRIKLALMYMNQLYNQTVVEGKGGVIRSNIFVGEMLYRLSRKVRLRAEAQYLTTHDDRGDWAFALAELSVAPHWMLSASDQYNCGLTHSHYWQTALTYSLSAHRIQVGWGRTRAGFNCSGGVCRYVPESKGFTLSYNYNF